MTELCVNEYFGHCHVVKVFQALAEFVGCGNYRLMVAYCSCLQPDLNLLQI